MKKRIILTIALVLGIWIGATWYDVPVEKSIRGNINWSNWR